MICNSLIGEKLVEKGIIDEKELKLALEMQKAKRQKGNRGLLGQTLVELGFCTEEDIAKVIAEKNNIRYISLMSYNVDLSFAKNLISPEIAVKYNALPIGVEKGKLLVAMKNPGDIIAIDDLRLVTGYEIQPVVTIDRELDAQLSRFINAAGPGNIEIRDENDFRGQEQEESINTDEGSDKPAVLLANQILSQAVKAGASDVHIEPQEKRLRIRFRIDGVLHEIISQPIGIHPSLVLRIKVMANMDIAEKRIPQDGRITLKVEDNVIDVRVASMPSTFGEKITMRLLNRNDRLITLEELGLEKDQREKYNQVFNLPYGFILITGPTGSGKSTTLYATLAQLNKPDKNIITIEDPVERRMDGITQIQVNTKAGLTFASGLRSILRSDPDTIMVGEIRDHETARIAVESALTGHLVLSTMHTNDASGAITRLTDMEIEPYLTASSLVGVIGQRLVRMLCRKCREPYTIKAEELLNSVPDFLPEKHENEIRLYKAKGCVYCNGTGYKGRTGIYEFLRVTEAIQKLILRRASASEIREVAIQEGMLPMRRHGILKVKSGATTVEELLRVVM